METNFNAVIEAILFVVGDDGISLSSLANALQQDEQFTQKLLDDLTQQYANDENRGIEIVCYGKQYKFVSKAFAHEYCQKLFENNETKTFSQAALETLAIIAYRQPITRVEIEEIRGVSCDMMLRKLLARNLIKEASRLETIGRPFTYEVTQEFMDTFSLKSLAELPELPEYNKESETKELFD